MSFQKICWPVFLYLIGYHLFLAASLPFYFVHHSPSWAVIGWTLSLTFISGLAITAGYHRLFSHCAYKAHPIVEAVLVFFGSLATQGSVLRWAHDHRLHHSFVDTGKDPYSVKKGLFHAHMLWMFFRSEPIDPKVVSDLARSRLLVFQNKHYVFCMLSSNIITFLFAGWCLNDYMGAFLFVWWVRMFLLHHTTWCINSLAHYWGTQFYSKEHSAVDNYLISLLTYGEGYHNYHHTFAQDYRNGVRWYHFDPAKWLIWTLHKLGLATNLKRVGQERITRQMLISHRDHILNKIKASLHTQADLLAEKINRVSGHLSTRLTRYHELVSRYQKGQKELVQEIRQVKKNLKEDWKEWKDTVKFVSKAIPLKF